jgi:carboxyl-terminal processing protease
MALTAFHPGVDDRRQDWLFSGSEGATYPRMKLVLFVWLAVNAPFAIAANRPAAVDPQQVAIVVGRLLEQGHYTRQKLDPQMSARVLESYLENLDQNKLYFTREQVTPIVQKYGGALGQSILKGDLGPAREIYKIYKQAVIIRVAKIHQLLKKEYTFTSDRTVALYRYKEPWPADTAEADSLWRDQIEGELLQEKLNNLSTEPAAQIVGRRYDQFQKSVVERDDEDLVKVFLNAAAQAYDSHSEYLGRFELEDFDAQMRLSLVGIGASLILQDGCVKVIDLPAGEPAARSGQIGVGDRIVAVAEIDQPFVDTVGMPFSKVLDMIRGKRGTVVRLQIIPANAANAADPSQRRVVELVRDEVKLTAQEARAEIIERTVGDRSVQRLGWITLPSFYRDARNLRSGKSTSRDLAMLLTRLEREKVQGLVLDLRRNGGGSLDEAIKVSGLFVNEGPVALVKDGYGEINVLKNKATSALYAGPLIVLTSKASASASEIFAAAMQDYGRAVIVGDSTSFGKGTVQSILELGRFMPNLSVSRTGAGALKLTTQKFYRVAGGSTQLRGVHSDIRLPSLTDNAEFGEAAQRHPLPYDEIEPVSIDLGANRKPLFLDELRKRSTDRVSQDPQFQILSADVRLISERLKSNRLSLNERVRRAESAAANERKAKEIASERAIETNDRDRRYYLTLADINEPNLKLVLKDTDTSAEPAGDPAKREALNVLSDLIVLTGERG